MIVLKNYFGQEAMKYNPFQINKSIDGYFLQGRVASFYGCELRKYTGFRVSTTSDIRSILSITEGPLILTSDSLSLYTRQGLNIFNHR